MVLRWVLCESGLVVNVFHFIIEVEFEVGHGIAKRESGSKAFGDSISAWRKLGMERKMKFEGARIYQTSSPARAPAKPSESRMLACFVGDYSLLIEATCTSKKQPPQPISITRRPPKEQTLHPLPSLLPSTTFLPANNQITANEELQTSQTPKKKSTSCASLIVLAVDLAASVEWSWAGAGKTRYIVNMLQVGCAREKQ